MPQHADRLPLTPGCLTWFCGRELLSRFIALWTTSIRQKWRGELISHCGIVALDKFGDVKHYESTTLKTPENFDGVQKNDPYKRINEYDGRVYIQRPRVPLTVGQSKRLSASLEAFLGTPYDMRGAGLAGTRWIKRYFDADRSSVFCDELVSMSLMDARKLTEGTFAPGDMTPASLAWWLSRHGIYGPVERVK